MAAAATSLAALLLAGCLTVGPDYEAPQVEVPDTWQTPYERPIEQARVDLIQWWRQFDDPVLNELIDTCALNNRDILTALAAIDESRALLGAAKGDYFPGVSGEGSLSRNRLSEATVPIVQGRDRVDNTFSLGGSAFWEVDVFGRIRRNVESARAGFEASEEDFRDLLVILYAETATAYFEVRALDERLRLAQQNVESQEKTLQITRDRVDSGLAPELDIAQAELNLNRTRSFIPQLREGRTIAVNALSVLVGAYASDVEAMLRPRPPSLFDARLLFVTPVDVVRQRPDVRRAERELAAQTAQIGVAQSELYPRFSLTGTFAFESFEASDLFEADSLAWGFGPAFSWRIFEGNSLRQVVRAEEARTLQALLQYEQTVLRAVEDVENSLSGVVNESIRKEDLGRSVTAAERAVKLAQELYINGLSDFRNVLENERSLFEQQDELATSEGVLRQNVASFYRAIGGGVYRPDSPELTAENQPPSP